MEVREKVEIDKVVALICDICGAREDNYYAIAKGHMHYDDPFTGAFLTKDFCPTCYKKILRFVTDEKDKHAQVDEANRPTWDR